MKLRKQSYVDDDGFTHDVLQYDDDVEFDSVDIHYDPKHDDRIVVTAYDEDGEEVYQNTFERRELSFDPITAIGRGETNRLEGTTPASDDANNVPDDIQLALNAVGMTAVPEGTEWLDG